MKTELLHILRPWDVNWYPRTMVKDTDEPNSELKNSRAMKYRLFFNRHT